MLLNTHAISVSFELHQGKILSNALNLISYCYRLYCYTVSFIGIRRRGGRW